MHETPSLEDMIDMYSCGSIHYIYIQGLLSLVGIYPF